MPEGEHWGGASWVFTHFLLKGLGEGRINADQSVSLGEVIPCVSEHVRRATLNAQSPVVAGKFDPAMRLGR